jgi:hypothetical protein
MSSYKARFVSAVKYTQKLGLEPGGTPIPWRNKISVKKARDVLFLARDVLDEVGMRKSSDLARNCVAVHRISRDIHLKERPLHFFVIDFAVRLCFHFK